MGTYFRGVPRGFLPLPEALSIPWTRVLLSSWSMSHQPRDPVQRGRGCRWALLLWGPQWLWACNVKMVAPVLGADGPSDQLGLPGQKCPVETAPGRATMYPWEGPCPAGPSLLHIFSPSSLTKPTDSILQHKKGGLCC